MDTAPWGDECIRKESYGGKYGGRIETCDYLQYLLDAIVSFSTVIFSKIINFLILIFF